jgi:multiple sugar transport system substrate-binding protein
MRSARSGVTRFRRPLGVMFALVLVAAACGDDDGGGGAGSAAGGGCDGEIPEGAEIQVQAHEGNEPEKLALEDFVEGFNASQDEVTASISFIPEDDYPSSLAGASTGGDLADVDVVEMDASYAFNYAWNGDLQPIDSCVPDELTEDMLPSIVEQGTYADQLWALGMFDSGLGLWASRSALEEVGARIPEGPADAWTVDEFNQILADLQASGIEQPLDLKINYGGGEYYSYQLSPIVWSAGGDTIDRSGYESADGVLNTEDVASALENLQMWFQEDYVDMNEDDLAFVEGRSVISWVGHWDYDRYSEALGDDLVLLPLPDFGEGSKTGQGSWQWAMGSEADADAAWAFFEYLFDAEQIRTMAEVSGGIPALRSVAEDYELTAEGGAEYLYVQQHEEDYSLPRPPHPAYATISSAFNEAITTIVDGGDVQGALDEAVEVIDQDIEDNDGYPEP